MGKKIFLRIQHQLINVDEMTEDHHFATTDSGKNHPQVLKLVGKNLMKLFTYSQNISPHYWGYATLTK